VIGAKTYFHQYHNRHFKFVEQDGKMTLHSSRVHEFLRITREEKSGSSGGQLTELHYQGQCHNFILYYVRVATLVKNIILASPDSHQFLAWISKSSSPLLIASCCKSDSLLISHFEYNSTLITALSIYTNCDAAPRRRKF
jgi:hypothetical protein